MKLRLLIPLAFTLSPATGMEMQDGRGLELSWDADAEPLRVNGVPMQWHRATGSGVAEFVARLEKRWRSESSLVQKLQGGDWRLLTRWRGDDSEVIQWRGTGRDAELVFSIMHGRAKVSSAPSVDLPLPSHCRAGRWIEGERLNRGYVQRSARCRGTPVQTATSLREVLLRDGWKVSGNGPAQLHAVRSQTEATTVVVGEGNANSWLVWTASFPVGGLR